MSKRTFLILCKSDMSDEEQPRYDLHSEIKAKSVDDVCDLFENGNKNDGTVIIVEKVAETVPVLQVLETA